VVEVKETTGVLPPRVEEGMVMLAAGAPVGGAAAAEFDVATRGKNLKRRAMSLDDVAEASESRASSMPVQTRERQLGDLFEYQIEHPVTIRRNQSALVPIVLRPFEGRPVLLYNKIARAGNPMRCVEFKNTSGLTLEGGPVTVLEAGSYVGEAMLETTKPDDQRLVPYAVELGVTVLDNVDSHHDQVSRVVIRKGSLLAYFMQVQQTAYDFNNKSEREQTLYLDHRRGHPGGDQEWKLFDTTEPHEVTENHWRFKFALPAKQMTRFVVKQRFILHTSHNLSELAGQQLAYWIERRYIDARTEQLLEKVVELRQEQAGLDEQIQRLEKERGTIHAEQKRIRENLLALGDRSAEKELRERFVRTLGTQEDRLEAIEREVREKTAARERCRQQINALLAELEYEADVR
jgi:hypothetical protein